MDCSPPGFSVHGILQASILEWVAIPFSRGSSQASVDVVWGLPLRRRGGQGPHTNSSILSWRIPWTEKPGGLQSMGSQRVPQLSLATRGEDWASQGQPKGKADGGGARVTAGPKRPHLSVCPGPNFPLQGRQGSRGCIPGSPGARM